MDREALYELLDMETGEDFQYFENFADLVEHEGPIENDTVFELINEIDLKIFAELCESYFYETLESVPGDQIDLYNLLENIKRVLIGLSEAARKDEDESTLVNLSDELNRFRKWFSVETDVEVIETLSGIKDYVSVRDALTNSRLEKISKDEYFYDFNKIIDYPIEEYIMTFADLAGEGDGPGELDMKGDFDEVVEDNL